MELTLDQALQKGIEAHKAGQVQEADRYYTAILKASPKHPDANHNMGVLAVGVGKVNEAILFFKAALEANPSITQFWLSYIDALIKLDRWEDAKAAFDQAKNSGANGDSFDQLAGKIGISNTVATKRLNSRKIQDSILDEFALEKVINLAKEKAKNGFYRDAEGIYQDILKKFPQNKKAIDGLNALPSKFLDKSSHNQKPPKAELQAVMRLYKSGQHEEALIQAKDLLLKFENSMVLLNLIGALNQSLGRLDEAVFAYKTATSIDPNYATAYNNMGVTLKQLGKLDEAIEVYKKAISINPNYADAYSNMGVTLKQLGKLDEAIRAFNTAISIKPDYAKTYSNLGNALQEHGKLGEAIKAYNKTISIQPENVDAYNNLGIALHDQGMFDESVATLKKALSLKPNFPEALNNLGNALKGQGRLEEAIETYKKAQLIRPDYAEAFNNMGIALQDQSKLDEAIETYKKALSVKPDYADTLWNLSGTSNSMSEAKNWIEKCLSVKQDHLDAKLSLAALEFYSGDKSGFEDLVKSPMRNHPTVRSFIWVFNLPKLPSLYFNRWALFDRMIELSKKNRPFYEFGVWRGEAFKHMMKTFKKGYGFDTFEGLPEDWHDERAGTYSSHGNVPKVDGGEFIVGKFEDTLPSFFKGSRPKASIINFDADLYSSTICALTHSKPIIDNHTILIFDEFIVNENWELDEYKALEEFCDTNHFTYEVLAISFFTKQVAVKIIGI